MKVLLLTYGSRGDVQPFVAVAVALKAAGHEPMVAAPVGCRDLVRSYGVQFYPLYGRLSDVLSDRLVREALETNFGGVRGKALAVRLMREFRPIMARVLDDMAGLTQFDAEVLVHLPSLPGRELADLLGVPSIPACLQPMWVPTSGLTNPRISIQLPRRLNRISYVASDIWIRGIIGSKKRWRIDNLGLPCRPRYSRCHEGSAVLHAFSKYIMPRGVAYPKTVHTTGYWLLPTAPQWKPSTQLVEFLAADDPPVCIGFGSFIGSDPRQTGRIILEAVHRARVRAIVVSGFGGIDIGGSTDRVLCVDDVPFDWLFSRVTAVVHHGGCGTVGAALAAGRPQIVQPFVYEQPFNAARLHSIGVATAPLPRSNVTPECLANAIRHAVTERNLSKRAEELKDKVHAEGGVNDAVRLIESVT